MRKLFLHIIFLFVAIIGIRAQDDSLVFRSGEYILGEIQSMEKGVLFFETDYSDNDFEIEWVEVVKIYSETYLYISLADGKNVYGRLHTLPDSSLIITSSNKDTVTCSIKDIVHMLPIKHGFKDRFSAEIDIGLSFARSNNLKQVTVSAMIGYKTEKWNSYITFNTLRSVQDDVDPIHRTESEFVFQYVIYKDWYLVPSTNYLANSEQNLDYRWNAQFGIGNYILRSNFAYWGISLGINNNVEEYSNDTPSNQTWEGFFGTELNLFNTGDLELFTKIYTYPGISEAGRWRVDGSLNIKYDLPLDFYIKLGGSINYDNRPAIAAGELDYVSTIGFGWEW